MENRHRTSQISTPMTYQITVQGRLDESWSDWFDGLAIAFERRGDGSDVTVLTGQVVDQAALHGLLDRIRDLNVLLLSLFLVGEETVWRDKP